MSSAPGLTAAVTRSISDIPRGDWDACFPGDPEGWAYYRAIEESGLTAFSFAYFLVREHGRVVAVAPAFMTDYSLDTMIQGSWRTLLQPLARSLGRLLTLRILCLGSPLADACHLGFAPDLARSRHPEALACLLAIANEFATAHGIRLLAVKDLADAGLDPGLDAAFAAAGYEIGRAHV